MGEPPPHPRAARPEGRRAAGGGGNPAEREAEIPAAGRPTPRIGSVFATILRIGRAGGGGGAARESPPTWGDAAAAAVVAARGIRQARLRLPYPSIRGENARRSWPPLPRS